MKKKQNKNKSAGPSPEMMKQFMDKNPKKKKILGKK